MKPILLGIALLLLPTLSLFSVDDVTIVRTIFVPSTFYVGDSVELRVQFQSSLEKLQVTNPFPSPEWGTIHDITLSNSGGEWEARIKFIPYAPGTLSMPAVSLGPISLEGITIHVRSVLQGENREPAGLRPQMLVPGTVIILLLQLIIVCATILGLLWLGRWAIPRVRHQFRLRIERRPYRRLKKSCAAFLGQNSNYSSSEFYSFLLQEARVYLADRLQIPAVSATSRELLALLKEQIFHDDSLLLLTDLFFLADRVRFAHEVVGEDLMKSHLDDMLFALAAIETEIRTRDKFGTESSEVKNVES